MRMHTIVLKVCMDNINTNLHVAFLLLLLGIGMTHCYFSLLLNFATNTSSLSSYSSLPSYYIRMQTFFLVYFGTTFMHFTFQRKSSTPASSCAYAYKPEAKKKIHALKVGIIYYFFLYIN